MYQSDALLIVYLAVWVKNDTINNSLLYSIQIVIYNLASPISLDWFNNNKKSKLYNINWNQRSRWPVFFKKKDDQDYKVSI